MIIKSIIMIYNVVLLFVPENVYVVLAIITILIYIQGGPEKVQVFSNSTLSVLLFSWVQLAPDL